MHTFNSVAVRGVLVMAVLRSVRADTITSCNGNDGVVYLSAGHHTVAARADCTKHKDYYWCSSCTLVGAPGAVIDGLSSALNYNGLYLKGSLEIRGNGQKCFDINDTESGMVLEVSGNVSFQDCSNMFVGEFKINGGNVSMTNTSISMRSGFNATNAYVKFTNTSLHGGLAQLIISNSHAIFERSWTFSEYDGYHFENSTIVASHTAFSGGHNIFGASNCAMNFTNSTVSIATGNMGIVVANCSIDATCLNPNAVFYVGGGNPYIQISDSLVRFFGCSCQLDHAIHNGGGSVEIKGGSMAFSRCQPYGGTAKTQTVVVV